MARRRPVSRVAGARKFSKQAGRTKAINARPKRGRGGDRM